MRRYVLRRVAALIATLFFVSVLVFLVIRILPGDPALLIMGTEGSPEAAARCLFMLAEKIQSGELAGKQLEAVRTNMNIVINTEPQPVSILPRCPVGSFCRAAGWP